jgi:hypothetical protein
MMIRSDEQVALEDLHRALRSTATGHRDAAGTLDPGDALTATLTELADRRDAEAGQVADLIRQTGELPDDPDADRETFRTAARHLKAALSRDALVRDRQHAEDRLAGMVEAAREALDDSRALPRIEPAALSD